MKYLSFLLTLWMIIGLPSAYAAELIGCPSGGYGESLRPKFQCFPNVGCGAGTLDDGSYLVPESIVSQVFPNPIPFLGSYTRFYVNINGNISFGPDPVATYTPDAIPGLEIPMIAAWFGDVDIRPNEGDIFMCIDPDRQRIILTWDRVGYYSNHLDKRNSFQIILTNTESSCTEASTFLVEFRYARLEWTTGDASSGTGGTGGVPAVAGIDAGDTVHAVALPHSRTPQVLSLVDLSNVDSPGVFKFVVAEGNLPSCGNGALELCEQCDDGNNDNTDECTNLCLFNTCGDGFVFEGHEECDQSRLSTQFDLCPQGYTGTPVCSNHEPLADPTQPPSCTIARDEDTGIPIGCQDIDECASTLTNECDPNAKCTNEIGSYTCECLPGFTGNGYFCEDIDECSDPELNNCEEGMVCINLPGSFACECAPGYIQRDNGPCIDLDECYYTNLNDCPINSTCINLPGTYECQCNEGFAEDPDTGQCLDIDECADPALNDCDPNAACVNTIGSYDCICLGDYQGDGHFCTQQCGDGVIEPPETCDPALDNPSDPNFVQDCRADCTYCGDGYLDPMEACDDGNLEPRDGCSPLCEIEPGFICTQTDPSYCTPEKSEETDVLEGQGDVLDSEGSGNSPEDCSCQSLLHHQSHSRVPWFILALLVFLYLRRRSNHLITW